ncbi:MAG: AMP-dependent synthetase/ligase [Gammaproteobacteria bacterium]|nr:AMP-dependent synthetase/ligase [Gammaproteobacteria bacterium]
MTPNTTRHISPTEAGTLDGLFRLRVARTPQGVACRYFDKERDQWRDYRWHQLAGEVGRWQVMLAALGLVAGDRVALSLRNGPEWLCFDQAALGLGLVVVPLYTDDRADNLAYILQQTGAKLLLLHDEARWRRVAHALAGHDQLQHILLLDSEPLDDDHGRLLGVARQLPTGEHPLQAMANSAHAPRALASIIYTSGTTGRPKGVMLSHHNMLAIADAALQLVTIDERDTFLSFLPLSHTLERTTGYYLPLMAGATIAYARSIAQLAGDLQTIKPTVLISVPRIYERIHGRITRQLQEQSALKRWLFTTAVAAGWHHFEWRQGRRGWRPRLLLQPLLQRLVGDKLQQRLGGRLRLAISGGAPLPEEIARLFIGLGTTLLQGYGLTETSPVVSVNIPADNLPSSVGVALPGVETRIGTEEELLVRGPGVMLGYWNDAPATAALIDPEGWLHTGDQARIDTHGHITITGRIKDILVLSNGEKVPPCDMEMALTLEPRIEQVLVVGEGRPYLTALIVLNHELWPQLAAQCGVDAAAPTALQSPAVIQSVQRIIDERLHQFPGYAKIRRFHLTLEPWSVENGLLTPTLKVKRGKVLARLQPAIDQLYARG